MPHETSKAYYPPLPAVTDAFGPVPPEEHLPLIRRYTLAEVPSENLYVRRVALANDAVDRQHERIPAEYLHRLAETLPGKSVLAVHNKQQLPMGLWYHAHVRPSLDHEPGDHTLEAHFYTVRTPENQHLRDMIDGGVIRHTSIAFRYDGRRCSTCGEDANTCPHMPGETYTPPDSGAIAPPTYFYYAGDPQKYESTEGSLVHLGAQRGSQITKSEKEPPMEIEKALARIKELEKELKIAADHAEAAKTASQALEAGFAQTKAELEAAKAQIQALKTPDDAKQQLAADGQAYREHLKAEITRLAGILKRETQAKTLMTLAGNCGSVTLKAIHDEFAAEVEARFPARPVGNPMTTDKTDADSPETAPGNFSVL